MLLIGLLLPLLALECPTCQDRECDQDKVPSHICRLPTTMNYLPHIFIEEYKVILNLSPKIFQCVDLEYKEGGVHKKQKGCEIVPKGHNPCDTWRNHTKIIKCVLYGQEENVLEATGTPNDETLSTRGISVVTDINDSLTTTEAVTDGTPNDAALSTTGISVITDINDSQTSTEAVTDGTPNDTALSTTGISVVTDNNNIQTTTEAVTASVVTTDMEEPTSCENESTDVKELTTSENESTIYSEKTNENISIEETVKNMSTPAELQANGARFTETCIAIISAVLFFVLVF